MDKAKVTEKPSELYVISEPQPEPVQREVLHLSASRRTAWRDRVEAIQRSSNSLKRR